MEPSTFFTNYLKPEDDGFYQHMAAKYELKELKNVTTLTEDGYFGYQEFLRRFMAGTESRHMFVYWAPGTGKTCLAGLLSQQQVYLNRKYPNRNPNEDKRILVFVRGETLRENFVRDIIKRCPQVDYQQAGEGLIEERVRQKRIRAAFNKDYEMLSFQAFTNKLKKLSDEVIRRLYSDRTIIIDEAHHLKISCGVGGSSHKDINAGFSRLFRVIRNERVIMLTATPMVNCVSELPSIANFILDDEHKLSAQKLEQANRLRVSGKDSGALRKYLWDRLKGKVMFIRSPPRNFRVVYMGETVSVTLNPNETDVTERMVLPMQTKLWLSIMSIDQELAYLEAIRQYGNRNVSLESVCNFAMPSEEENEDGTSKYYLHKKEDIDERYITKNSIGKYSWGSVMARFMRTEKGESPLPRIRSISAKTAEIIRIIELPENQDKCVFIKTMFVSGAGAIAIGACLNSMGYEQYIGTTRPQTHAKRYAIIDDKSDVAHIVSIQNEVRNATGKFLRVIIGGPKVGEGISLLNVRQLHLFSSAWQPASNLQAEGRAQRANSLQAFAPEDRVLEIYRHAAIMHPDAEKRIQTIDLTKYGTVERKDISIKSTARTLKEISIVGSLHKGVNVRKTDIPGTPDADYTSPDYDVVGCDIDVNGNPIECQLDVDYTTYNLKYSSREVQRTKEAILAMLKTAKSVHVKDVKVKVSNSFIIIKAMHDLVQEEATVLDAYGRKLTIVRDGDVIYASSLPGDTGNQFFNTIMSQATVMQRQEVPLREQLRNANHTWFAQRILPQLTASPHRNTLERLTKNSILRTAVFEGVYTLKTTKQVFDIVNEVYGSSAISLKVSDAQEEHVYHILEQLDAGTSESDGNVRKLKKEGKTRVLFEGGWHYASMEEDSEVIDAINKKHETASALVASKFAIYGVYNRISKEFRIVDKTNEKAKNRKGTNQRDLRTQMDGLRCMCKTKSEMMDWMRHFGISPPKCNIMKLSASDEEKRAEILTQFGDLHVTPKDDIRISDSVTYTALDYDYLWGLCAGKSVMCDALYKHVQKIGAIVYK